MIYNYFKRKNNFYKIRDYFELSYISENEITFIRKKIKKFNEHNFLNLFNDVIYYKPIRKLTIQELECFFIENQRFVYEQNDNLPFLNSIDNNSVHIINKYITINLKSELKYVLSYLLATHEYPKQIIVSKLLELKERILEENIYTVVYIKNSFIQYCESGDNSSEFEKIKFSLGIIDRLNEFETELFEFVDEIDIKIKSLNSSITKQGNYLINIDNNILERLYKLLEKYIFIDQNKTTLSQFIQVLKSNWEDHDSIIHLEMDNRQFRSFLDKLKENLKVKIPLTLIEFTGNIENKNGKISSSSVYSSGSRKIMNPKRNEEIESIFQNLKEKG